MQGTGRLYGVTGLTLGAVGGAGVFGSSIGSDPSPGVHGQSQAGNGVYGRTTAAGASGVYAENASVGYALAARMTPYSSGTAVFGDNYHSVGWAGYFNGRIMVTGTPYCNGCTTFTNQSDARLKKNIAPLTRALDQLLALRGVTFEWKNPAKKGDNTGTQRGFIAQDVEKVLPEWVSVDQDGFKAINTRGLEAMLVESLRTLKEENNALRDRVRALEEKRSPTAAAGFSAGSLFGVAGITMLAGALVISRRRNAGERRAASSET